VSRRRGVSRRRSRQVALQVLYALDLAGTTRSKDLPTAEETFERVAENFELPEGARDFGQELVRGITLYRAEIDALLSEHATNWRVSRMAAVDRNILRIGAYELTRTETPTRVVLDEAIELARRFGDDPSPSFVNGVLDAVARAIGRGDERRGDTAGDLSIGEAREELQ
jgi:N utilization substance protein B